MFVQLYVAWYVCGLVHGVHFSVAAEKYLCNPMKTHFNKYDLWP